jgi:urease accessory protein
MIDTSLQLLQLLHLADSALPIGATAHSYGLETLAAEEMLTVDRLQEFLSDYLTEVGVLEAAGTRAAYRMAQQWEQDREEAGAAWIALNRTLSALRPARESRAASATLGRRLLQLILGLTAAPAVSEALEVARHQHAECHHCAAFGLIGGALGFEPDGVTVAYLQQALTGLISACQRLLPLGQQRAGRLLWDLKPALLAAAERSRDLSPLEAHCFTPLLDLGSMRHPGITTRLFIS